MIAREPDCPSGMKGIPIDADPDEAFCIARDIFSIALFSLFNVLSSLLRMRVVPYVPDAPALFCPAV